MVTHRRSEKLGGVALLFRNSGEIFLEVILNDSTTYSGHFFNRQFRNRIRRHGCALAVAVAEASATVIPNQIIEILTESISSNHEDCVRA